jgi:hypothetical protein
MPIFEVTGTETASAGKVAVSEPEDGLLPDPREVPVAFAGVVDVSTGTTTTTVVGLGAQPVVQSLEVVVNTGAILLEVTSAGQ